MTGWYRTGTVSVTNGSNAVAGTGTLWITNGGVAAGDVFTTDNVTLYEVQAVTADGAIQLDRNYAGSTASGIGYAIIHNFSPLAGSLMASINALVTAYTTGTQPYELDKFIAGSPTASQIVYERIFAITVTLPASLTGSLGKAGTAATASTTFTIKKNGTAIGTIVFGASATVPTFSFTAAVTFLAGDVLSIVAPATPDATLANIALVLLGSIA
jgi:hypothetical protein